MDLATRMKSLARGGLGMGVMVSSLGLAALGGTFAREVLGLGDTAARWVEAGLCGFLAFSAIWLIRTRLDGRTLSGLGLNRFPGGLRDFLVGLVLTGIIGGIVFGLGGLMGWVEFGGMVWSTLIMFAVTTLVIVFLFEALPEELTLRGYAFNSLNATMRRWSAGIWTVVLFMLTPPLALLLHSFMIVLLGIGEPPTGFVPGGEDPVSYMILLMLFGAVLVIARVATGSLWTCVGLHMTFMLLNRIVLDTPAVTGWEVSLTTPDAILLIPAYLLITGGALIVLARIKGHRMAWRARNPEAVVARDAMGQ